MDDQRPGDTITLSICVLCRARGGPSDEAARLGAGLAAAVLAAAGGRDDLPAHEIRGVRCMSQCLRPCTIALSAPGRFTYLFGDLDPARDAAAVVDILPLYAAAPDGFLPRDRRPPALQAGILGRIPPLGSTGELVTLLTASSSTREEPVT